MNIEHFVLEMEETKTSNNQPSLYEAPAVESVLTPDALEREVLYAGVTPTSQIKN